MLEDQLERLATSHSDCLIAAYADIGTGVTLVNKGRLNATQDILEDLCVEAALTLGAPDAPALGMGQCDFAVKAQKDTILIFVRSEDEPNDALLCMCRPGVALDAFIEDAKACILSTD